jgi:hypothetical protein
MIPWLVGLALVVGFVLYCAIRSGDDPDSP